MAGLRSVVAEPEAGFELIVLEVDTVRAAIRAVGELDLAARPALVDVLHTQEAARRRIVRLDLSRVTLLDCSCLGVLVASHHRLLGLRGLLVLSGVDARVERMLRVAGLAESLFIVSTDHDSLGSVVMAARRQWIPQQRRASTA